MALYFKTCFVIATTNRHQKKDIYVSAPSPQGPPTHPRHTREGQGQPSRFLDFLEEIKGKPMFGLVCHSLLTVCTTAVQADTAFCCRAGPCSKFDECLYHRGGSNSSILLQGRPHRMQCMAQGEHGCSPPTPHPQGGGGPRPGWGGRGSLRAVTYIYI